MVRSSPLKLTAEGENTEISSISQWLSQHGLAEIEKSLDADGVLTIVDLSRDLVDADNLASDLPETASMLRGVRLKKFQKALLEVQKTLAMDSMPAGPAETETSDLALVPMEKIQKPMLVGMQVANVEQVTQAQVKMLREFHRFRKEHYAVACCQTLTNSFVAEANAGGDLSYLSIGDPRQSTLEREEANERARRCIHDLSSCVDALDSQVHQRQKAFAQLALSQSQLEQTAIEWQKDLMLLVQLHSGKSNAAMLASTFAAVNSEAKDYIATIAKSVKPRELREPDHEMVKQCENMMKNIVYSELREKGEQDAFSEALDNLNSLHEQYVKESATAEVEEAKANHKRSHLEVMQTHHADTVRRLEKEKIAAENNMERAGIGRWIIEGVAHNAESRKLKEAYDKGNMDQLKVYESISPAGNFSSEKRFKCYKEETPTPAQVQARERLERAEQELKQFSEQFYSQSDGQLPEQPTGTEDPQPTAPEAPHVSEANHRKRAELARKRATELLKQIEEQEKQLKANMKEIPPAHKANSIILQKVSCMIKSSVRNICPCADDLSSVLRVLKLIAVQTEDPENGELELLLNLVADLIQRLTDDRTKLGILGKFGVSGLRAYLTPIVDPTRFLQEPTRFLEQVEEMFTPQLADGEGQAPEDKQDPPLSVD